MNKIGQAIDATHTGGDTSYTGGNDMIAQTKQQAADLLIAGDYGRIQPDRLIVAAHAVADMAEAGDAEAIAALPSIWQMLITKAIPAAKDAGDAERMTAITNAALTLSKAHAAQTMAQATQVRAERDFDANAAIATITGELANAAEVFEYAVVAIMDSVAIPDSQRAKLKIALIYQGGEFTTQITGLENGSGGNRGGEAQRNGNEQHLPIPVHSGYVRKDVGGNHDSAAQRNGNEQRLPIPNISMSSPTVRKPSQAGMPISDRNGYVRTDGGGETCEGMPRLYALDVMPKEQTLRPYMERIHDAYILSEDIARSVGLPLSLTKHGPSGNPGRIQPGLLWTWLDRQPAARDTLGIPADEWLTPVGYPRDAYPSVVRETAHPSAEDRIRAAIYPRGL